MTSSYFPPVARHANKRGFALIVTITIMALLVVISLGMLSLSSIELRASKNDRAMAEAQANARMALMIAIGELQKQMGPDQRISANADILSLDDFGTEVPVANPHWTGVWDSWVAGDITKAPVGPNYPSDESHHQTIGSQPDESMRPSYSDKNLHFRKWLVSLPDSDIDSTDLQNTAITLALDADRTPSDSSTAVELVGVGSLGASAASEDYVNASLIQLLDKDSAKVSGRYGWWIGDESQKARIMDDSYETDTVAAADAVDADKIFRSQAPASTGTQAIDELANVNDQSRLAAIPSTKTLDLISRNAGNANASPSHRFHDISTHSMSLLTDVREGGLKRDLSTLLERTVDPDEVFNFNTYTTTSPLKRSYKTVTNIKPRGDDFMLYRFDDFGRECVPIQDLNAYYQLYDNDAYISGTGTGQGSRGRQQGVAYSSTLIPDGIQISATDLGGVNTQDKYKRAYTNRYRQPVPIKFQFMIAMKAMPMPADIINHFKTMPKPVNWNDRHSQSPDPTILNYPNFDSTHFLAVSIIPSVTMWNPSNLPVVMKGGDPIAHAQRMSLGGVPLYMQWEKKGALGTFKSKATQLSWLNGSGLWYGSNAGHMFNSYLAGSRDVLFQPGEVKVFSYLPNDSGIRRLRSDNDSGYLPEQELHDGWDPGSYLRTELAASPYHGGAKWNGNPPNSVQVLRHVTRPRGNAREYWEAYGASGAAFLDSPDPQDRGKYHYKLMFNGSDEIGVNIGTADFFGKTDDGSSKFSNDIRANSGIMFWCIQHETYQLKYNNEFRYHQMRSRINTTNTTDAKKSSTSFNSELIRMGMPLKDSGPTRADDITVPSRLGQNIIDYDLEGDGIPDEWPFMQFSLMAACEVGGASNAGHMAGRRYANRPFLHSTAMASPFFDKTDPASLYNYGWNWWAEDANDSINEGVQLDENNRGYYGGGYTTEEGTTHVVQQEIPIVPPLSIAALSHAHLGGYSIATDNALGEKDSEYENETVTASGIGGLFPHTLQAIGNSYANPNLLPNKAFAPWARQFKDELGHAARTVTFADHSYLANKALWDEFFFSSIIPKRADRKVFEISTDKTAKQTAEEFFLPEVGQKSVPLPNRRMHPYMTGLDQSKLDTLFTTNQLFNNGLADKIAAHLMVEGGFNINSTSPKAWETLLKSLRGKPVNHLDTDPDTKVATLTTTQTTGTPVGFGFVTNSPPITSASTEPSEAEQWTSSRVLSDVEVEELAVALVKQVKMRGPFLSLSEFINRKLDGATPALAAKGALQAALDDDSVSINANFRTPKRQLSSTDIDDVAFPEALTGPAAYGSAAYIDQADVLRNLSAQLTPRGDTFVIRTYGDSMDTNGKVVARAWCEAVVQRVPEYTDSSDSQETKQADLSSSTNRVYGRKLQILSFRWLNAREV